MKNPKPEPVVTSTVCSLCGLNWDAHGDKPTAATCVGLLRDELARRPVQQWWTVNNAGTNWVPTYTLSTSGTNILPFNRPDEPPDAIPAAV